jgi:acetylornithine deacetylase/succinyl-diaminopimelate desuccinylase-like protein
MIHAPNEHIHVERYEQGARHIAQMLLEMPLVDRA